MPYNKSTCSTAAQLCRRLTTAAALGRKHTFFVRAEHGEDYVEMQTDSSRSVAGFKQEIANTLPGLRLKDPATFVLRKVVRDEAGNERLMDHAPSDGCALDDVGLTDRSLVVVTVELPGVFQYPGESLHYTHPRPPRYTSSRRAAPVPPCLYADAALRRTEAAPGEVFVELGAEARKTVAAARAHRRLLQGVPILTRLRTGMSVCEARSCGVVLPPGSTDDTAPMTVGVFGVPALDGTILSLPREYDQFNTDAHDLLLVPQRVQYACELVEAMARRTPRFSTHLTGPQGTGKSGALLLTYLVCAARGLLTAYFPRVTEWIRSAGTNTGSGAAYFLDTVWRQNADLIVDSPELRHVFQAALHDARTTSPTIAMRALHEAVRDGRCAPVAILLDDAQHIIRKMESLQLPAPIPSVQLAGRFFEQIWHSSPSNECFPLMSAASPNFTLDTQLSADQHRRLRFVEPLADADRAGLQALSGSPIYVQDAGSRDFAASVAGNGLRDLTLAAAQLRRRSASPVDGCRDVWSERFTIMEYRCAAWVQSLPVPTRSAIGETIMSLSRGEVPWGDVTRQLYDESFVFRTDESESVRPFSPLASAALLRAVASRAEERATSLWAIPDTNQRGQELKRQVLAGLECLNSRFLVPTKLLDGRPGTRLHLHSDYSLPFGKLAEVTLRPHHVLYRPLDPHYPCDGILTPPVDDPDGHVYLVECSATDPLADGRVGKVGGWYKAHGFVADVRAAFPGRSVTAVLCYDKELQVPATVAAAAVAMTRGEPPPPLPKWPGAAPTQRDAASAAAAPFTTSAAVAGPDVQPGANLDASLKGVAGTSNPASVVRQIGDEVHVLDRRVLCEFLGVKTLAGYPY